MCTFRESQISCGRQSNRKNGHLKFKTYRSKFEDGIDHFISPRKTCILHFVSSKMSGHSNHEVFVLFCNVFVFVSNGRKQYDLNKVIKFFHGNVVKHNADINIHNADSTFMF